MVISQTAVAVGDKYEACPSGALYVAKCQFYNLSIFTFTFTNQLSCHNCIIYDIDEAGSGVCLGFCHVALPNKLTKRIHEARFFLLLFLRRLFWAASLIVQNAYVQFVACKLLNKLLCFLQKQSIIDIGAFIT